MALIEKMGALVRGLVHYSHPEAREDAPLMLNTRGDLIVVQAMPELAELVRMGGSFAVLAGAGLAALTGRPTTVSGLSINNNEPATGLSIIIDSFGSSEEVIDATQTDVTAIYAMLNKRGSAQATGGTAEAAAQFNSLNGRAATPGNVSARRGATVINDNWYPHSTEGAQMAAAVAGANFKVNEARVRGLYIVPPSGTFSVQAVKAAAAAALQQFFFIRFHLAQLPVVT